MFSAKVKGLAENMKANAFNLHLALEQKGAKNQCSELIKDEEITKVVQGWIPDLASLNENRLLFGYPRTLNQLHMLRKNKVYPNKVFIINCDEQAARTRVCKKLFGKDEPETPDEYRQVENVFEQYARYGWLT